MEIIYYNLASINAMTSLYEYLLLERLNSTCPGQSTLVTLELNCTSLIDHDLSKVWTVIIKFQMYFDAEQNR